MLDRIRNRALKVLKRKPSGSSNPLIIANSADVHRKSYPETPPNSATHAYLLPSYHLCPPTRPYAIPTSSSIPCTNLSNRADSGYDERRAVAPPPLASDAVPPTHSQQTSYTGSVDEDAPLSSTTTSFSIVSYTSRSATSRTSSSPAAPHVATNARRPSNTRSILRRLLHVADRVTGRVRRARVPPMDAHVDSPLDVPPSRPSRSQVPPLHSTVDQECHPTLAGILPRIPQDIIARPACPAPPPPPPSRSCIAVYDWCDPEPRVQPSPQMLKDTPSWEPVERNVAEQVSGLTPPPPDQRAASNPEAWRLQEILKYIPPPNEALLDEVIEMHGRRQQGKTKGIASNPEMAVRGRRRQEKPVASTPAMAVEDTNSVVKAVEWPVIQLNYLRPSSSADEKWLCAGILGQGTFGTVYLVYHIQCQHQLALKVIQYSQGLSRAACRGIANEIKLLRTISQAPGGPPPFLLTPYTGYDRWYWRTSFGFLNIATSFCQGGELARFKGNMSERSLRLVAAELVLGIQALHDLGWTHGDLKITNVLIDKRGHVVIGDFGGCRETTVVRKERREHVVYTASYAAPELLQSIRDPRRSYDATIDYWSLGVMMATLFLGGREKIKGFMSTLSEDLVNLQKQLSASPNIHPGLEDFIMDLLRVEPALRLQEPEIKQHPYFSDFDDDTWEAIRRKKMPPFPTALPQMPAWAHGIELKTSFQKSAENLQDKYRLVDVLHDAELDPDVDESFDVRSVHKTVTSPM